MYIFFIGIGLLLLLKGADFLVNGSSSLAKRLKISNMVIGLTIVAFGTSAPELVVSLLSALSGKTDIAVGNIIGSNIANILLILGIATVIYPIKVQKGTAWKEIPLAFLASFIVLVLGFDQFFSSSGSPSLISRGDGLVLLSFFVIFLYYIFGTAKKTGGNETTVAQLPLSKSLVYVALGLGALILGGKWVVDGAVELAHIMGLSETIIGLTIVAVGTSLPELATSAVAAYRKNPDIAIGNVVGSNIFNVFWILGLSALFAPLSLNPAMFVDVLVSLAVTAILFLFLFVGKKHLLERWQGGTFIMAYIAYVVFLAWRG